MTDPTAGAEAVPEAQLPDPEAEPAEAPVPARFSLFSRWLHWVMAVLIVAMLFVGAAMTASLADYRFLVSVHKPLGMAVLLLAVIRLVNRITHRAPPHPRSMGPGERRAALASECLMYGLMVSQPLVGWAMVAASDTPFVIGGVRVPSIVPHGSVALFGPAHDPPGARLRAFPALHPAHAGRAVPHTGAARRAPRQDGPVEGIPEDRVTLGVASGFASSRGRPGGGSGSGSRIDATRPAGRDHGGAARPVVVRASRVLSAGPWCRPAAGADRAGATRMTDTKVIHFWLQHSGTRLRIT